MDPYFLIKSLINYLSQINILRINCNEVNGSCISPDDRFRSSKDAVKHTGINSQTFLLIMSSFYYDEAMLTSNLTFSPLQLNYY